jgi:acetoacetyl-CoA reductase
LKVGIEMADMHGQVADMQGQVALVGGGVRGIGLAIWERLAARGVTVAAQRFLDRYGERGASVHRDNIDSNEDCERVIQEVLNQHGRLDILKVVARIPVGRL